MKYTEFKAAIQQHLKSKRQGATWVELRETLALPYKRPCPEWTRRLEEEIGLVRRKGAGRALVWELEPLVLIRARG
ncbi:hypothetical protein [Prosthecobacter sp.]|uniref:hypothetical protein n=1 Tax=Prosthecobacter sp. TaxID=1965333 RepID=UPI002488D754|nr:hypothetical protein [Prosthecobacter sp.]MDI1314035.1 hypothetical protein [Prosthecobacter sp.]